MKSKILTQRNKYLNDMESESIFIRCGSKTPYNFLKGCLKTVCETLTEGYFHVVLVKGEWVESI